MVIRLRAANDSNGNPRRCYVRLTTTGIADVWVESYDGLNCVPRKYRKAAQMATTFNVTFKEFKCITK